MCLRWLRWMLRIVVLGTAALVTPSAVALPIGVMDFEGLANQERVNGFYDAGLGSLGSGPGPDFNVVYPASLADPDGLADIFDVGALAFSGTQVMTTLSTKGIIVVNLDIPAATQVYRRFQFYYGTTRSDTEVTLYSGQDLGGSIIAQALLPTTGSAFNWTFFRLDSDPGTSIGSVGLHMFLTGGVVFDNLAFPIPAPGGLALLALAIALLSLSLRRRLAAG